MNTSIIDFNFEWATQLIDELVFSGVTTFVVSPGARSSALTLAVAKRDDIAPVVHFDERGCGFYALGAAKWSCTPAVLICTSGTAGGNYLPAVMEASNSEVPLIVITADRPPELHGTGANQTITQTNLFTDYVVSQFTLPPPAHDVPLERVRPIVRMAVEHAVNRMGPVHINAAFREPLLTSATTSLPLSPRAVESVRVPEDIDLDGLTRLLPVLNNAKRGVVALGTLHPTISRDALIEFLDRLNWPCFCDVNSQLRFGASDEHPLLLTAYNSYLRNIEVVAAQRPDCVLRIGTTITSKFLEKYLATCTGHFFQLAHSNRMYNPEGATPVVIKSNLNRAMDFFNAAAISGSSELLSAFVAFESTARSAISSSLETDLSWAQWTSTYQAFTSSSQDRIFFIGNSMAIREADMTCPLLKQNHHIFSNRGVSGIDGLIATATGISAAAQKPATVVLGDLSLLHDINSLALVSRSPTPLVIVVINNDGGAIFSLLPTMKDQPEYTEFFQTPHGISFEHAARLFGLDYYAAADGSSFKDLYIKAINCNKSVVLEASFDATRLGSGIARLQCA